MQIQNISFCVKCLYKTCGWNYTEECVLVEKPHWTFLWLLQYYLHEGKNNNFAFRVKCSRNLKIIHFPFHYYEWLYDTFFKGLLVIWNIITIENDIYFLDYTFWFNVILFVETKTLEMDIGNKSRPCKTTKASRTYSFHPHRYNMVNKPPTVLCVFATLKKRCELYLRHCINLNMRCKTQYTLQPIGLPKQIIINDNTL